MFFTEKGVNIIQFGSGDIEVNGCVLKGEPQIGAVSLIPLDPPVEPNSDIDRSKERAARMVDTDLGVHTRLVFTDTRSIDALINQLQIAQNEMVKVQSNKTV